MSALVPYNNGGFSSAMHYGSHTRRKDQHYDRRFMGQQPFIPRLYPILPNYPPSFYPNYGYPPTGYNQFGRSTMSTDLISLNQSNKQYRYAQYLRHIDEMQRRRWQQRANTMPLPVSPDAFPSYRRDGKVYHYESEHRFLPYPVLLGQGMPGFGSGRNLGYGYLSNLGHPAGFNTGLSNFGGARNLPPKVRVIFMPRGFPSAQQPCSGALAMPPFTFNRMSQPLCSLPLPPPLPQIGSLPLSPLVQQMVMQQYTNPPVAVLPFPPNFQMPQPMISGYPQILQQQQQLMMPPLNLQLPQSIPLPFIPPTLMPGSMPVFSPNPSFFPFTDANSSRPQYPQSNYPSICRACIPPPPRLNIAVADHLWAQHCSACHHIPADANRPNVRPNNGRSTPLLRHPTVLQNAYNLPMQPQQYPHINASVTMRPWLHKMPSLPQGAVIISDQYIPRKDYAKPYHFIQRYPVQHTRVFNSASRSMSLGTPRTSTNTWNRITPGVKSQQKYEHNKSQSGTQSTSITPLSYSNASNTRHSSISSPSSSPSSSSTSTSSCSLCAALAVKEQQISDKNSKQNLARKQLSAAARNITLRYNFQTLDLPAVYHNNRYLKSSDTDSTSLSNSGSSPNLFINKEYKHDRPPSPIYLKSIKKKKKKKENLFECFVPHHFIHQNL